MPVEAQSAGNYYCGTNGGIFATIFEKDGEKLTFLIYETDYFSKAGWPKERRCNEVSKRFQRNYEAKTLNYIVPGVIRTGSADYRVICASTSEANGQVVRCSSESVIFTLLPHQSYDGAIEGLAKMNQEGASDPYRSSNPVYVRRDGRKIIVWSIMAQPNNLGDGSSFTRYSQNSYVNPPKSCRLGFCARR